MASKKRKGGRRRGRGRSIRRHKRGVLGKLTEFFGRPLRAFGIGLGVVTVAEIVLMPPPGGSQSLAEVAMDPNQTISEKGTNAILALKGQLMNPSVWGDAAGSAISLWLSKKLRL